jgi:hypothetical protein
MELVGILELTVIVDNHMLTYIDKYPMATTSTRVICTQATKSNVLKLVGEIKDYKKKTRSLEEQVSQLKGYMNNLFKFKSHVFSIQYELNIA